MVGNKPIYGGAGKGTPVDPQPITQTTDSAKDQYKGTRAPKVFSFTSRCFFYEPKAKCFFPEAFEPRGGS